MYLFNIEIKDIRTLLKTAKIEKCTKLLYVANFNTIRKKSFLGISVCSI